MCPNEKARHEPNPANVTYETVKVVIPCKQSTLTKIQTSTRELVHRLSGHEVLSGGSASMSLVLVIAPSSSWLPSYFHGPAAN